MKRVVVVAGGNVRNIAESAFKAGFEVIAVTKHVDADLRLYCRDIYFLRDDGRKEQVEEIAQQYNAPVVLSSGMEDAEINAEILGCEPKVTRDIVNKLKFYRKLEKAGIPFPEILRRGKLERENEVGKYSKYILKPVKGGGGEGIEFGRELRDGYILQRYVEGIACSVSLMVGREPIPIAANYILHGERWLHAKPFQYCGNITPFPRHEELYRTAVETVSLFDLTGSVGIDFILAERPYVLEINPRFQGSLDSIEWACDVNLFKMHVDAVEEKKMGKKVEVGGKMKLLKPKRYACRAILFAPLDVGLKSVPAGSPFFADITPVKEVKKGEPLVSILSSGRSKNEVLEKVRRRGEAYLRMQGVTG
jgi:hypothetical protein